MNALPNFDTILQLHQAGKLEEARAAYLQFLQAEPQHVEALVALATLYLQRGELSDSAHYFQAALRYQPRHVRALHHYALCLKQQNLYEPALAQLDLALTVDPQFELAYKIKFSWLVSLGRHAERLQGLRQALQHLPQAYEFELQLIAGLREANENAQALAHIDHVLASHAKLEKVHNLRANILLDLGRQAEAVLAYQAAISLQPDYANAHGNLGTAYLALAQYENALASFDRALQLNPETHGARNNRANALQNLHRFDDALSAYDDILSRDVHDNATALNKGLLCLLLGRFKEGWPLYEARWHNQANSVQSELLAYPLWNGVDSLEGKTIILHPEQGLGDTINFCRYARLLAKQAAKVYLVVNSALHRLMQHSIAKWDGCQNIEVLTVGAEIPDFHFQLPLLSAPRVLETELQSIPDFGPYLFAEAADLTKWQQRLGVKSKARVGLVWSGSENHSNDKNRSLPLGVLTAYFQQHLGCELEFHALQKEIKAHDLPYLEKLSIHNHADELVTFSDTAALIMQLDLVISVDTSVAHLAAALGVSTWIMLPFVPDFRWLLQRQTSPWYPSVQLFRQDRAQAWDDVLQALVHACQQRVKATAIEPAMLPQPVSRLNEANEWVRRGDWVQAEQLYRGELAQFGPTAKVHNNLGVVLQKLRRFDEALASFELAMQLDPHYVSPHFNKSICLLSLGQFEEGWRLYEWRWQTSQLDSSRRSQPQPLWSGAQRIAGKRILIYAEQGLGDTLQFSRFISALKTLGAEVLFEVQPGLLPLLRSLPVALYALGTAPQDVDFQCPLLSLPHALKLTLTKIPNSVPYLQVEADQQQAWRQKLAPYLTQPTQKKRKKIGLVWAGSAKHPNDAQRSIPFALFNKLFQHDADYFVLQKELSQTDRRTLQMWQRFGKTIVTLDAELSDFSDTAAVMLELDLIISVDTSVAHLAGALAKPVYLMLPYEPDFRWMLDRSDSPWYPTMTLFRQQQAGDWSAPLAQMQRQLTRLLQ